MGVSVPQTPKNKNALLNICFPEAPVPQTQNFHGLLPKLVQKFTGESVIVFLIKPAPQ
jgi:hypothetical protein